MTTTYDFSDPLIRDLVHTGHRPEEHWVGVEGTTRLTAITCQMCTNLWPCEARTQLRAWMKNPAPPTSPVVDL